MKKIISLAMIFLVAFSAFSMFITHSESVTGNEYRRKIIVDNSGNSETLTGYQVFFNVTYDSDMQPDFDDLRFTWYNETSGQEVSIDYWLDKYVDSEYAHVWVEVPLIRGLGQEVLYMYYGDPDAVSGSNGEETFVFFDDFSTDTTSNYEVWYNQKGEISWDPNGWLFVNATTRQPGGASNVHVRHKTALIDATEEKYWLETRCMASGTGFLDYIGVTKAYKLDSKPSAGYFSVAYVFQGRETAPMNHALIQSHYAPEGEPWEFRERCDISTAVKDQWFRIGLGTSPDGAVIGRFYDDDYNELGNLANQTIHQDNEWWVDLIASRGGTEEATLYAYFDYARVRKFTVPEPSYSIGPEEPLPATINIDPDTLNLKSNGQWITVYITLPEGYDVEDIVFEKVYLNGVPAVWSEIQNGVYMAKFDRAIVRHALTEMIDYEEGAKFYELTLTVTGELIDRTKFNGSDTITVIKK